MPIQILVGNNEQSIRETIKAFKKNLQSDWFAFNYHEYSPANLGEALSTARTPPFGDVQRLVIIPSCQFNNVQQWGVAQLEQLQDITRLPPTTTLVFIGTALDKRLKHAKLLLTHGTLQEHLLVDPWKTDAIQVSIQTMAEQIGVSLSAQQLAYLTEAIGNNTLRAHQQLLKLKLYGTVPDIETLRSLVPAQTQTSLQLADSLRRGNPTQAVLLLKALLDQAEHPNVVIATLITQFRTWLWIRCALAQKTAPSNHEVAKICSIANPNRVYYLKQDVAATSIAQLSRAITLLFELDVELKQGAKRDLMINRLIAIAHLFTPT
jgi:DNA polymerase-3 subunit delta